MRAYIFTKREREALRDWLESGKVGRARLVLHRVRRFKSLERDIEFYRLVRERMNE